VPLVAFTRYEGTSPAPSFSRATELGKRLSSSSPMLADSKPIQKYYRKVREARKVHLDENSFADSL